MCDGGYNVFKNQLPLRGIYTYMDSSLITQDKRSAYLLEVIVACLPDVSAWFQPWM